MVPGWLVSAATIASETRSTSLSTITSSVAVLVPKVAVILASPLSLATNVPSAPTATTLSSLEL